MTIKKMTYLLGALTLLLLASCSHIDVEDRLIPVGPVSVNRAVLIEDFTGQRCSNCPLAADLIENLQEQYGSDVVIAVGIHSGAMGKGTPLRTDLGDEYYNHWGVEYQPIGLVNRNGLTDYTSWNLQVYNEIQKPAFIQMGLENVYDADTRNLNITVSAQSTADTKAAKLQLWLVEDGIVSLQFLPDGSKNPDYVHQHVLRASVNGTWGDQTTLANGEEQTFRYSYVLDEAWKAENMSLIAFFYDETGVLQVTKAKISN